MTGAAPAVCTSADRASAWSLRAVVSGALAESSVAREQFHSLSLLLGSDPVIDRGPTGALPWGVLDPETGDVLGAGASVAEALAEALTTARGWAR